MRLKLKELGINTTISVYGQYVRVGGNNTILLKDIYDKLTGNYLCDHLWLNKYKVPYSKHHNDFVIIEGVINQYQKYYNEIDYTIRPLNCTLIKPFVFRDGIVYLIDSDSIRYWYYKNMQGFDNKVYYNFSTNEVLHLYEGNEKERGYRIVAETDEYYDLYYKGRDSHLRVYKSLNTALSYI